MRLLLGGAALLGVAAMVAILLLGPLAGPIRKLTSSQAERCLRYHAARLNDPASAYVVGSKTEGDVLVVDARAKNGFGGYGPVEFRCVFASDGAVDPGKTQIAELKAELEVLKRRAESR